MTPSRGSRVGPYKILDLPGEGDMGAVYRAPSPTLIVVGDWESAVGR